MLLDSQNYGGAHNQVTEKWRLLIDSPASGAWNMAVDEALLMHALQGTMPVFRIYAWRPAALSLGCFQDAAAVDFPACMQKGIDVVRRPTGGRAVLHDNEVTYAIVLPVGHALAKLGVIASYRVLSEGLTSGLARFSLAPSLATPERPLRPQRTGAQAACFDAPSWHELTVSGRKLVGSAQVRRNGALLQHGSVPISMCAERLYELLKFDDETSRSQAAHRLNAKAAGIADVTGRSHTWQEVAAALVGGVQEALACKLVPDSLTPAELTSARQLAIKHADTAWVMQRSKGEPVDS